MYRVSILAGLVLAFVAVIGVSHTKGTVSLDRIAGRVEKANVIPEETRAELRQLIDRVAHGDQSKRTAAAVARIERAMELKPRGHSIETVH